MNVCDICKKPSKYEHYVTVDPNGKTQKVDLCGRCYTVFCEKKNYYNYKAYEQAVIEIIGEPVKKPLRQRLKFWGGKT